MGRLHSRRVALVLSLAGIAIAGCGSSSSSKTTAKAPPATPSTPSAPSTVSTSSTPAMPSTPAASGITPQSPLNSPAVRKALISYFERRGYSADKAPKLVDCAIKYLTARGVTTVAQFGSAHDKDTAAGKACAATLK